MKIVEQMVTCSYAATHDDAFTTDATAVRLNQENTGFLAVTLDGDNPVTSPTPKVRLVSSETDAVYGAVATINPQSRTVGVITKGIVPFKADPDLDANAVRLGSLAAVDIDKGVAGSANGKVQRGGVAIATGPPRTANYTTADGKGRGLTISRNSSGSNHVLWVDLSTNVNDI